MLGRRENSVIACLDRNPSPNHYGDSCFGFLRFFFLWRQSPTAAKAASLLRFLDHTQPVWLLLTSDRLIAEAATCTTQNKHKTRTCMPSARFQPAISALKQLQTTAIWPVQKCGYKVTVFGKEVTRKDRNSPSYLLPMHTGCADSCVWITRYGLLLSWLIS
jgi:hypothetical protein